jgi:hypothetical protein
VFSALEQACHLRDIEIDGYQVRLRRTCQETRPLLVSLDGYALAEERRYRAADPAQVLAAFREGRSATIEKIRHVGNDELSRPAMFERAPAALGPVSDREEGGARSRVIEATPPQGRTVALWFDARTGLLARSVQRREADTVTSVLDDYREVSGVLLPLPPARMQSPRTGTSTTTPFSAIRQDRDAADQAAQDR